ETRGDQDVRVSEECAGGIAIRCAGEAERMRGLQSRAQQGFEALKNRIHEEDVHAREAGGHGEIPSPSQRVRWATASEPRPEKGTPFPAGPPSRRRNSHSRS